MVRASWAPRVAGSGHSGKVPRPVSLHRDMTKVRPTGTLLGEADLSRPLPYSHISRLLQPVLYLERISLGCYVLQVSPGV